MKREELIAAAEAAGFETLTTPWGETRIVKRTPKAFVGVRITKEGKVYNLRHQAKYAKALPSFQAAAEHLELVEAETEPTPPETEPEAPVVWPEGVFDTKADAEAARPDGVTIREADEVLVEVFNDEGTKTGWRYPAPASADEDDASDDA